MIAFAVLVFAFSFGPVVKQEINYFLQEKGITLEFNSNSELADFSVQVAEAEKEIAVQKEAQSYGVNSYFSDVIPKIDAKANIITYRFNMPESLKPLVTHAASLYLGCLK